jgi:hypothetical protein
LLPSTLNKRSGEEEIMLKFSNCAKAEKGAGLDFFSA